MDNGTFPVVKKEKKEYNGKSIPQDALDALRLMFGFMGGTYNSIISDDDNEEEEKESLKDPNVIELDEEDWEVS